MMVLRCRPAERGVRLAGRRQAHREGGTHRNGGEDGREKQEAGGGLRTLYATLMGTDTSSARIEPSTSLSPFLRTWSTSYPIMAIALSLKRILM